MKNGWQCILIGMLILTGISSLAWSDERRQAISGQPDNTRGATDITEHKAISIAKQHIIGRVLAIQLSDHIYRIKILSSQGTLHTVLIDAANGRLVSNH